jgi:TetR/AcrR family transcriptional regulator, transcriptional repressor for nem operon
MPYSLDHSRQTRARIVAAARKLFNRNGFDGVTIGQIMEEAGLTHGGFYRHFSSKSDLYAEVLDCFFTNPEWSCGWKGMEEFDEAADLAPQIIRAYLSNAHFDDVENACPMVALPSDVARASANAKRAYQAAFEGMVQILEQGAGSPNRTSALAIAALCVGGMVIARASDDRLMGDELRQAAMLVALKLGGWDSRNPAPRVPAPDFNSADSGP